MPDGQIELGDIMLAVDGHTVDSGDDLLNLSDQYKIGDTVTLKLLRGGRRREIKVTLAARSLP